MLANHGHAAVALDALVAASGHDWLVHVGLYVSVQAGKPAQSGSTARAEAPGTQPLPPPPPRIKPPETINAEQAAAQPLADEVLSHHLHESCSNIVSTTLMYAHEGLWC